MKTTSNYEQGELITEFLKIYHFGNFLVFIFKKKGRRLVNMCYNPISILTKLKTKKTPGQISASIFIISILHPLLALLLLYFFSNPKNKPIEKKRIH